MEITTKDALIYKGIEIIHSKGFSNTGIQEILKACSIPKGSFYFYFSSKDDFGLQMIEYYAAFNQEMIEDCLTDLALSPMTRFRVLFDELSYGFSKNEFKGGCLLGNLAQETCDLKPSFQRKLKIEFANIQRLFADCLQEAKEADEISAKVNVDLMAEFMLNSWEGALLRMKVEKSTAPLKNCMDMLLNCMLVSDK